MYIHLIVAAAALILLALNIKASLVLKRAACYERKQKQLQLVLVWLLPVAGGILVWTLAAQSHGFDGGPGKSAAQDVDPCRDKPNMWP